MQSSRAAYEQLRLSVSCETPTSTSARRVPGIRDARHTILPNELRRWRSWSISSRRRLLLDGRRRVKYELEGLQNELPLPTDVKVECDYKNKINISWKDDTSLGSFTEKLIYDIQISYDGDSELQAKEEVLVTPDPTVEHYWIWTSPLNLQCLTHVVKIRARHQNKTSKWIEKPIYGDNGTERKVYAQGETVGVGTRRKYCCISAKPNSEQKLKYRDTNLMAAQVINLTYIFDVYLSQPSKTTGDDLVCEPAKDGFTVFVGYTPEVHNFSCETRNLKSLQCHWKNGRDSNLKGIRKTKYSLNGRECLTNCIGHHCHCAIKLTASQGAMDWILTSKNYINETNTVETADPRHRVYLFPPHGLSVQDVDKRSANLHWHWNESSYESLPMVCQALLNYSQAKEIRKESRGTKGLTSLTSLTLSDLYPAVTYSVRVRCHSAEHFWKWGDWSSSAIFTTKEDIPEALDIWMQIHNENTSFVVWKSLTPDKSHGKIQKYQVKWGTKLEVLNGADHRWYEHSGREGKITVSAVNSAGVSPPSSIVIPAVYSGHKTARLTASDGGFNLSWTKNPKSMCGYVVDWIQADIQVNLTVDWIKIPTNSTSIRIQPEHFREGTRYILSLYVCTSEGPELQQKWEGYSREKNPLKSVSNFKAEQSGNGVLLTWEELSQEDLRGFLSHYEITYYEMSDTNAKKKVNITAGQKEYIIGPLQVKSYTFRINAVTGGGKGPQDTVTVTVTSQVYRVIVEAVIALAFAILTLICVIFLCYKKRAWIKENVYPEIPEPRLDFLPPKGSDQLFELPHENVAHVTHISEEPLLIVNDKDELDSHTTDQDSAGVHIENFINKTYKLSMLPIANSFLAHPPGYQPHTGPKMSLVQSSTSSYHVIEHWHKEYQPQISMASVSHTDEHSDLIGSPTSVSSSQPLL
ncbi:leukemia inhibitory factor receptor-like isoform X2 [Denticeps clupeoides]|uniref:leukemia inhibitory factor receptor-like isoform X2 n=1 Tax=Denticeps clupeoides TaxID=299321 RepID=UPI0010A54577|nr:leukemia inhibitory factor receptor-like isoform X2 [Denticeps clupeoides]